MDGGLTGLMNSNNMGRGESKFYFSQQLQQIV